MCLGGGGGEVIYKPKLFHYNLIADPYMHREYVVPVVLCQEPCRTQNKEMHKIYICSRYAHSLVREIINNLNIVNNSIKACSKCYQSATERKYSNHTLPLDLSLKKYYSENL